MVVTRARPPQVLHHMLEGSLKPELQALDTSMRSWSPPAAATDGPMSWTGLAAGAADLSRQQSAAAAAHAARVVPQAPQAPQKRSQVCVCLCACVCMCVCVCVFVGTWAHTAFWW